MNYIFKWGSNFMDLIAYDQSTAYIIKSIKFMHSGLKNTEIYEGVNRINGDKSLIMHDNIHCD